MEGNKSETIDESLYSRQLYVMGHEAQQKMQKADVLLVGLNGLGVEAAKNIILAGVKSVTLYDPTLVSFEDLSSHFFLTEFDIGKPRAEVTMPKLAELNPYVNVSVLQTTLDFAAVEKFSCVVLVDSKLDTAISIGDFCHAKNICFIMGDTRGVFGRIFCDFGDNFFCSDANGEAPTSAMIASVTNDSPALVTVLEEMRHNLESGDTVGDLL